MEGSHNFHPQLRPHQALPHTVLAERTATHKFRPVIEDVSERIQAKTVEMSLSDYDFLKKRVEWEQAGREKR